jgi:hypothetical protein
MLALAAAMLPALRPLRAQPVLDRALNEAQIAVERTCMILKVSFNVRIRYASHFPLDRGDELRITVNAVDHDHVVQLRLLRREAARVPAGALSTIRAIVLETDHPTGPVLRIQFVHPVAYQVAPDPDTVSMVVAIAGNAGKKPANCHPIFPESAVSAQLLDAPGGMRGRVKDRPAGVIAPADLAAVAAWMDEGRAALRKNNQAAAIALFTKVLKYPENQYSAEAQELLGLARQKSGDLAQARAVYEDYLRRYPGGEGSERVRQRLAGILTASGEGEHLRTPFAGLPGVPGVKLAHSGETTWTSRAAHRHSMCATMPSVSCRIRPSRPIR